MVTKSSASARMYPGNIHTVESPVDHVVAVTPTISQAVDVVFAFLRKYNYTDLSLLCTEEQCDDVYTAVNRTVEKSKKLKVTQAGFKEER